MGITEPMASGARAIVPAEEAEAGLDLEGIRARFADYFATARGLQRDFADTMPILLAFEAESYAGYEAAVADFIAEHRPDYIVGSVHHVDDPSCRRPAHAASPPLRATTHTGLRVWGNYISAGVRLLEELGFDTCWPVPGSGWSSG